jgi:hypothetical protein
MSLRLLSTTEKSLLLASFAESYGFTSETLNECEVLEGEEGYWAVSPKVITLPLRKLMTDSIGLLIARNRGNEIIPTIAALQLYAKPYGETLRLSRNDALKFINRKAVAVKAKDGSYVVFIGNRAIDRGEVKRGILMRVEMVKPK